MNWHGHDIPEPDWASPCGEAILYNADCLDILPKLTDGCVDACVTDPPYGIDYNREATPQGKHLPSRRRQVATVRSDDKPFDPSPWLGFRRVVLWGANNYASRLPDQRARSQALRWLWSGAYRISERGEYYHPTQKPVELMGWCVTRVGTPERGVVFDPYMGSGTTGVACARLGRRFIGIEIEPKYFEIAKTRIDQELRQGKLAFDTKGPER
jgi:site-specific DNA-methyltransferase (adenine-specific)